MPIVAAQDVEGEVKSWRAEIIIVQQDVQFIVLAYKLFGN